MIPNDPIMLLSYINTRLRDSYKDLYDLCEGEDIEYEKLINKLESIGYSYHEDTNQFR